MLINNTNILLNSGIKLNRIIDEKEFFFKIISFKYLQILELDNKWFFILTSKINTRVPKDSICKNFCVGCPLRIEKSCQKYQLSQGKRRV